MCSQSFSKRIWRSWQCDNDPKRLGYTGVPGFTFCLRKVMSEGFPREGDVPMPTSLGRKCLHVPPRILTSKGTLALRGSSHMPPLSPPPPKTRCPISWCPAGCQGEKMEPLEDRHGEVIVEPSFGVDGLQVTLTGWGACTSSRGAHRGSGLRRRCGEVGLGGQGLPASRAPRTGQGDAQEGPAVGNEVGGPPHASVSKCTSCQDERRGEGTKKRRLPKKETEIQDRPGTLVLTKGCD